MTPERAAAHVARWVRCYTRPLPAAVAERRLEEITADLHDHIACERARGTGERRLALSILSRMVRGLLADASWRRRVRVQEGHRMRLVATLVAAVGVVVVAVLFIQYAAADDAPGGVLMGLLLIVGALAVAVRSVQRSR